MNFRRADRQVTIDHSAEAEDDDTDGYLCSSNSGSSSPFILRSRASLISPFHSSSFAVKLDLGSEKYRG